MDTVLYTNEGANTQAIQTQTELAASKIRLWQSGMLTLAATTTKAELIAAEATFTGYPSGGIEFTTWAAPILAPETGYAIQSPIAQFAVGSTPTTTNVIGGWWVELATSGDIIVACSFGTPVPMEISGQGLPVSVRLVFPN